MTESATLSIHSIHDIAKVHKQKNMRAPGKTGWEQGDSNRRVKRRDEGGGGERAGRRVLTVLGGIGRNTKLE